MFELSVIVCRYRRRCYSTGLVWPIPHFSIAIRQFAVVVVVNFSANTLMTNVDIDEAERLLMPIINPNGYKLRINIC